MPPMTTIIEPIIIMMGICVPSKVVCPSEKRYWPYQCMKPITLIIAMLPTAITIPWAKAPFRSSRYTRSTPLQ